MKSDADPAVGVPEGVFQHGHEGFGVRPDGAQVGARVYVEATRVIALPDEAGRR